MRYRRATLLPLCFSLFRFSSHGIEPAILDVRITISYCVVTYLPTCIRFTSPLSVSLSSVSLWSPCCALQIERA
jgi:hypothetical protein